MSLWLFFSLLAPICWGIGNIMDSVLRRDYVKSDSAMTLFLAASRLPIIIAFFIFAEIKMPGWSGILWLFFAGIFWMLPFLFYYKALNLEETSRVVLLIQTTPIFILMLSFAFIGERLSIPQIGAFILISTGAVLASMKHFEGKWHLSKALLLILLANLMWAISDVIFKAYQPDFPNFISAFTIYFIGSFSVGFLLLLFNKREETKAITHFKSLPVRAWIFLIIDQVTGIGGSASFAYALTLGKASLTSVIINIQPLVIFVLTPLFAIFIYEIRKEDWSAKTLALKLMSFVLIMIGMIYIY